MSLHSQTMQAKSQSLVSIKQYHQQVMKSPAIVSTHSQNNNTDSSVIQPGKFPIISDFPATQNLTDPPSQIGAV